MRGVQNGLGAFAASRVARGEAQTRRSLAWTSMTTRSGRGRRGAVTN